MKRITELPITGRYKPSVVFVAMRNFSESYLLSPLLQSTRVGFNGVLFIQMSFAKRFQSFGQQSIRKISQKGCRFFILDGVFLRIITWLLCCFFDDASRNWLISFFHILSFMIAHVSGKYSQ